MFDWLSTDFFMPHGHCYLWDPRILWLQVLTNLSIALAYFAISATLGVLVWRAKDIPFKWMYAAFGVFIVTCGFTHLMDVVVIWKPQYWLDSMIRLVTAIASVMTAVLLPPLVPQALAIARGAKAAHDRGIALETAVKELELMYARARELDDQKTRFFANVSHELRTPLTLILGPLGKLRDADLPEEDRRHVEVIDRNARALLKHVNELLDVARVDAGGLAPSYADVDVAHLVRSSAAAFESAAAERRITLTVRTPDEQRAAVDPDQLQRVLVNLLGNAFKFTPDGGAVRCELRGGAGDVRVVVADSGPGIPPDERELVFERFRQSPSTSPRHQASSGLGLAIVRELVRLHEGRVEVGDAAEGGAEFRITLPVEAPPDAVVRRGVAVAPPEAPVLERPEVPRAAAVAPSPGAQVVVVEDNPDLRQYIAETLEEHATVVTAADGHAGLEAVTRTRPDLVVTDVMMPGMSGDRLLDALRAAPETRDTPVLVLTAKADDQLRVELLRRGAQDFLAKPFAADELRARAANLIAIGRMRRLLQEQLASREDDVVALARDLAARNRDLARSVDEMRIARDQAERASQARDELLRAVSHELRTPLTSIGMQVHALRRDPAVAEAHARALARLDAAQTRLGELVDRLLERVRVEAGQLTVNREPVELAPLVRAGADALAPRAADKGLALRVDVPAEPVVISTDPVLVRTVVLNLVENAIKYTDAGSVTITLARDGGDVTIAVRTPGAASRRRIRRASSSRSSGSSRCARSTPPASGSGCRWCATSSTRSAARSPSTPSSAAGRRSRSGCPASRCTRRSRAARSCRSGAGRRRAAPCGRGGGARWRCSR